MISIRIDNDTAARLTFLASAAGAAGIEDYLRLVAGLPADRSAPILSPAEFDAEVEALSTSGPGLPDDFSRDDIVG